MTGVDIVLIIVIAAILSLSVAKIISEKKKGNKCIGCPHGSSCGSAPQKDQDDKTNGCGGCGN